MKFLTLHGEFFCEVYFALQVLFPTDGKMTTRNSTLFQIVIPLESIITICYWFLVHKTAKERLKENDADGIFLLYS